MLNYNIKVVRFTKAIINISILHVDLVFRTISMLNCNGLFIIFAKF